MVSVIVPCYNNGVFLVELINCFRCQTSNDWEMIIVDDGSTDDTPQIIKDNIADMPNVQFYQRNREPKGSVVCRNIGFEHASGKYVCHIDADDLVSPTFVEHRVTFMENHPEIDYASFLAKTFLSNNGKRIETPKEEIWGQTKGSRPLLYYFLKADYPFSVWNNIYVKNAINNLPWDENVLMFTDFSYILPGILAGLRHSFCDDHVVDYYYRHDMGNNVAMTSNAVSIEKCKSTLYLFEKTLNSLKKEGLYLDYKEVYFDFFLLHFKNLLFRRTEFALPDFYALCGEHYSRWKILRLKIVAKISMAFPSNKLLVFCFYFLGGVLFRKKSYLDALMILLHFK